MSKELFKQPPKPWEPDPYQKEGLKFLLEHACAALFLDPSMGKTSMTLAAIKFLKKRGMIDKVLIIAPRRPCYKVWPLEIEKWKDFNDLTIEILHGPKKDEALKREADIYVINPEGLDWLLQPTKIKSPKKGRVRVEVSVKRFKTLGFDTLVVDELSKFKHPKTNRFKSLQKVLHTFSRRWGLTGSPAANGLIDLFGQCYILDMGNAFSPYITHFRHNYFMRIDGDEYNYVLQPGAEDRIYEKLEPLVFRLSAEDHIKLPKEKLNKIYVDLPPKAQKIYDELEKYLFTQIEDKVVTAANTGVAIGKCRQVTSGGIYINPEIEALIKLPKKSRDYVDIHTEKLEATEELIGELQGNQLLIAYDFNHDLTRFQRRFGKDVPYIGGGVSTDRGNELIDEWNRGSLPFLLVHPRATAHGLNLQESHAHHICWYTQTWNYELYDQLNRRLRRRGNEASHVFIHHILVKDTIDEIIYKALQTKKRGQLALFKAIQELKNARLTSS